MANSRHNQPPQSTTVSTINSQVWITSAGNTQQISGIGGYMGQSTSTGTVTYTKEELGEYDELVRERKLQTVLERKLMFRRLPQEVRATLITIVESQGAAWTIKTHEAPMSARERELGNRVHAGYYSNTKASTHPLATSYELGLSLDDLKQAHRDQCAEDMIANFKGV